LTRLLFVLLVAFAVLTVLAVRADAEPLPGTPATCDGQPLAHHVHRARALIRSAYELDRWVDPTPATDFEKRAWQKHRRCVSHPPSRFAISEYRDKRASAFAAHYEGLLVPPGRATLEARVQCESGGDYQAVDPSGTYFGGHQFDLASWRGAGGVGNPADASPREQDYRSARWDQITSGDPWPNCP
jgi:hypothetical protein